ncbi:ROK family protein [Ruegeria sp.]|uniref:ROK family protein n=1 Tax=Ruegeria sp. TaxID=1879320 RepID=UPI002320F98D|nr:ROK family protein [Ruegeria sp.]MDA7963478.1 ROK family protein [Ruegeria sp.]
MSDAPTCGGIDLGGTKIEATLFDATLTPIKTRRVATPQTEYADLLDALSGEIAWLRAEARQSDLPVGVGIPGLIDPVTGCSHTANLPAKGKPLGTDLMARNGGTIRLANDCKCFALSEATRGAGDGYRTVFGLILGTGLGGGVVVDGALLPGPNMLAGEVGHAALPAPLVAQHQLPLLPCGCGRKGCFETYLSGAGMTRLCQVLTGQSRTAPDLVAAAASGETAAGQVFAVWLQIAGELLHNLQLHLDPDCIVLGGGLSKIDGLDHAFSEALAQAALPALRAPVISKPEFGDSSGTRGAALLVRSAPDQGMTQ